MRIRFTRLSDEQHLLEIERPDGHRESVECETRSYLMHDLLHYAVESEAQIGSGFWGLLASGKTLEEMNDRAGKAMSFEAPALRVVEQLVGALSNVAKGMPSDVILRNLQTCAEAQGSALPPWLTDPFVEAVRERMRRLVGHWKATPNRGVMEMDWPQRQKH